MGITVHVIDCSNGRPADGVALRIERKVDGEWRDEVRVRTDETGGTRWPESRPITRGVYRVELDTDGYFASLGILAVHPTVTVAFRVIDPDRPYDVPVLITPHAYLTYQYE